MKLNNLLCSSVEAILEYQNSDGSFPPGHNGPYKDPETPVRNTAHWCITILKAYKISNNQKFLDAAVKCGNYLLSKEARPMDSVFFCRKNPEKDFANGLVGQAWAIEALVELNNITSNDQYLKLAIQVFLMHPYNKDNGAWISKNVDGSNNGFDGTFNHQLWFAAAGGMLIEYNLEIKEDVTHFIDCLENHLKLYNDGCIRHDGRFLKRNEQEVIMDFLRKVLKPSKQRKYMRMKSVGYHGFNLYAFALLKKYFPKNKLWKSNKFIKTLYFASSEQFKDELQISKYGFPYNPPGFEMALAFQEFNYLADEEISNWVSWQINKCFDLDSNLMIGGGTYDKITSAARIYEATRLKNYTLNKL